jgi:hypothetical protein
MDATVASGEFIRRSLLRKLHMAIEKRNKKPTPPDRELNSLSGGIEFLCVAIFFLCKRPEPIFDLEQEREAPSQNSIFGRATT